MLGSGFGVAMGECIQIVQNVIVRNVSGRHIGATYNEESRGYNTWISVKETEL